MSIDLTTSVVVFDSKLAQTWLDRFHFDFQRKPKRWAIEYYANEMRAGNFKPYTMIEIANVNGKKYLVDGQHRLMAIASADVKMPLVVLETDVANEQEVGERYAQTDRGLKRTTADQFAAVALPEEFGLSHTKLNAIGAACVLIDSDFTRQSQRGISLGKKLEMIREYAPYACQFYDAIEDYGVPREMAKIVLRAATLAVAIVTYRYSSARFGVEAVDDFWIGAISDNEIKTGDPRKLANRHMLESSMMGAGSVRRQRVSASYSAKYIAHCFNAFVSNESRAFTRVLPNSNIKILGSPWSG